MTPIIKFLIFMIVILLIFWGLNIYKHIRSGWTKLQKIADITGLAMIIVLLILLIVPLLK